MNKNVQTKCSTFQHAPHCLHRLPLHVLQPSPLLLSLLLDFFKKIHDLLPALTRMHSWQVVDQVTVHLLKLGQTDDPHRLVRCPYQPPTNERNDPFGQGVLQHFRNRWVWTSPAVAILHIHQTQDKKAKKGLDALTVKGAPRFLSSLVHTHRVAIHRCPLGSRSPSQRLFSAHVDLAG